MLLIQRAWDLYPLPSRGRTCHFYRGDNMMLISLLEANDLKVIVIHRVIEGVRLRVWFIFLHVSGQFDQQLVRLSS